MHKLYKYTLRKKYPYSELFWSVFSRIRTEYGEIRIYQYLVRMRENADQNNSEYGHFSWSGNVRVKTNKHLLNRSEKFWIDKLWKALL